MLTILGTRDDVYQKTLCFYTSLQWPQDAKRSVLALVHAKRHANARQALDIVSRACKHCVDGTRGLARLEGTAPYKSQYSFRKPNQRVERRGVIVVVVECCVKCFRSFGRVITIVYSDLDLFYHGIVIVWFKNRYLCPHDDRKPESTRDSFCMRIRIILEMFECFCCAILVRLHQRALLQNVCSVVPVSSHNTHSTHTHKRIIDQTDHMDQRPSSNWKSPAMRVALIRCAGANIIRDQTKREEPCQQVIDLRLWYFMGAIYIHMVKSLIAV